MNHARWSRRDFPRRPSSNAIRILEIPANTWIMSSKLVIGWSAHASLKEWLNLIRDGSGAHMSRGAPVFDGPDPDRSAISVIHDDARSGSIGGLDLNALNSRGGSG